MPTLAWRLARNHLPPMITGDAGSVFYQRHASLAFLTERYRSALSADACAHPITPATPVCSRDNSTPHDHRKRVELAG
jgi:hypothetical protein